MLNLVSKQSKFRIDSATIHINGNIDIKVLDFIESSVEGEIIILKETILTLPYRDDSEFPPQLDFAKPFTTALWDIRDAAIAASAAAKV